MTTALQKINLQITKLREIKVDFTKLQKTRLNKHVTIPIASLGIHNGTHVFPYYTLYTI